uniref:Integrator complex subunit 4 n=1 Tax=Glossina palpalis gambiensis TaxID=67801 RepID=A0A1B0BF91_9MUSC
MICREQASKGSRKCMNFEITSASLVLKRPHSVIEVVESSTSTHKEMHIQTTAEGSSLVGKLQQSIALLENVAQQNSKELLEVLVKIADELVLDDCQLPDLYKAIKKLLELFRQERDGDTTIRVKILRLLADLAERRIAEVVNALIDEIIAVLKHEKSQKVVAQGLSSLHKIGAQLPSTHVTKIAHFAQEQLISESHHTQKNALLVLSAFVALTDAKKGVIDTVGHYADSQDSVVRAQSLRFILCLGARGRAVDTLEDDYECVRKEALRLSFQLGVCHPDYMISCSNDDEEEMRLIDAAFSKVNLRRKKTAHERGAHLVASGEWSSGKRWGDDAPQEQLETATISLIPNGACGALVHGLDDEFMEVRIATVNSMCKLALRHPDFAVTCLDFLVDMFNDEIEDVRLKAIYSLTAIAKNIVLREDQLVIMLSSLEDFSVEVHEGLHLMLGACRVSTQACLLMVVQKLLDVLTKYPQDKFLAFDCMRKVRQKHANLCMAVTSHLLQDHPFFDSAERDLEDPAAQNLPPIISLLPYVTLKHYAYLRDAMPTLVPELPIEGASTKKSIDDLTGSNNSREYLETILAHINEIFSIAKDRVTLLKTAQDNLKRLGEIDPEMLGTANFFETFLEAQIQIEQLQSCTASQHNRAPLKESLAQLVHLTYGDMLLVKQICLRASALHLVLIVRDRSQSALGPCQMLLQTASDISSFLDEKQEFQPDDLTTSLLNQLGSIVDPKPGRVFREILPLVQAGSPVKMPPPNVEIKMCVANILEPCPQMSQDNVMKVTAGLIAALPFVPEIDNLQDMRIKIKYPDQHTHTVVPIVIMTEQGARETNVKLRTTILLSHSVWTKASFVEITLCLVVRPGTELELCKPAKILFAPKPVRRGI